MGLKKSKCVPCRDNRLPHADHLTLCRLAGGGGHPGDPVGCAGTRAGTAIPRSATGPCLDPAGDAFDRYLSNLNGSGGRMPKAGMSGRAVRECIEVLREPGNTSRPVSFTRSYNSGESSLAGAPRLQACRATCRVPQASSRTEYSDGDWRNGTTDFDEFEGKPSLIHWIV